MRESDHDLGLVLYKARFCHFPIIGQEGDNESYTWDYASRSTRWSKNWLGARAALYFAKSGGAAFVVVLTFLDGFNECGLAGIDVHIMPAAYCVEEGLRTNARRVKLRHILVGDVPFKNDCGWDVVHATSDFAGRVMTARRQKEVLCDEEMFVLDLSFSGVKRKAAEIPASDRGKFQS